MTLCRNLIAGTACIIASNSIVWGDPAIERAPRQAVKDAAIAVSLPPGSYTVDVEFAAGSPGLALVEVYEINGLIP